ncbi:MAG TPA: efflux RND transporter periplasmic adaptor subunit [Micropepsaceae bacterium]|nr:efflux RND transporter periplasmic adaptor subunit [Micropepsaceae bacterium]
MNAPVSRSTTDYAEDDRKPRRGIVRAIAAGVLILILGAYWYASGSPQIDAVVSMVGRMAGAESQPAGAAPPVRRPAAAAPVRVGQAVRRDLDVIRRTPGTVIANTMVQVTSQVQGIIESEAFKEGQFVKKGELLFQIDPRPFQAALAQSQAQLARDRAQLVSAQADADRAVALAERGIVSAQQRDQLVAAAKALQATITSDQAAINIAELNVEYSQIRSPVNGKTGPVLIQPGNLVQANSSSPIVTIAEIQPVRISFTLPQSDLALILARQRENALVAIADVKDSQGKPVSAPVDFVSNAISDKSGTVELRATFPNKELTFLPGQLVNITVVLDKIRNAVVVPHDAVNDGPNGTYVYVVDNGKARQQPVKLLFDDSANVAIDGGVKSGDTVIIDGQLRVNPGDSVNVQGPAPNISVNLGLSGLDEEDQPGQSDPLQVK